MKVRRSVVTFALAGAAISVGLAVYSAWSGNYKFPPWIVYVCPPAYMLGFTRGVADLSFAQAAILSTVVNAAIYGILAFAAVLLIGSPMRVKIGLAVLAAVVVLGLGIRDYRPYKNVRLGDADYPVENPKPRHFVRFHVLIPQSLTVHFLAVYRPSLRKGVFASSWACAFKTASGLDDDIFVSVPLTAEFEKDADGLLNYKDVPKIYVVRVATDRWIPGRCEWRLADVAYTVDRHWPDENRLFRYDAHRDDWTVVWESGVWCGSTSAPLRERIEPRLQLHDRICAGPFRSKEPIHDAFARRQASVVIGGTTGDAEFEFYDDEAQSSSMVFP